MVTTQFAGGRHERRVKKITAIEKEEDAAERPGQVIITCGQGRL